ncbi:FTP domain-containing protein [Desulfonema magnum]|uniref:FTP domain-containing protein n=2 Tax=Desulfonema magnum TaxID=45655 RepID=A0A975BWG2_9BACT|nr:FTP domain-containing protein [Desulfonema magnum]
MNFSHANVIRYFQISCLFIPGVFLFFITSCSSHDIQTTPENIVVRYGENGTPTYIKGENLCSGPDHDAEFQALKKRELYEEIAYQFFDHWREMFKLDHPRKTLEVTDMKIDDMRHKHIKFQQKADGVPVWGRTAGVHLNPDNEVYLFMGNIEPELKHIVTTPKLSEQAATEAALSEISDDKEKWQAEEKTLSIWMKDLKTPCLVYIVTLVKGLAHKDHYFVDALSGKILHKVSGTPD